MVDTAGALLIVACCVFAVAGCTNPTADASNTPSNALPPACSTPAMAAVAAAVAVVALRIGAPPEGSADCSGAGMLRLFGAQPGTGTDAGDARWSAGGLGRQ